MVAVRLECLACLPDKHSFKSMAIVLNLKIQYFVFVLQLIFLTAREMLLPEWQIPHADRERANIEYPVDF